MKGSSSSLTLDSPLNVDEENLKLPLTPNLVERFDNFFIRSLYKNEDLLFKIIFDKKYRP